MKTCLGCGQEKPVTEFYKDSRNPTKYWGKCKECSRARNNAYQKTSKGMEIHREENRKYQQTVAGKEAKARWRRLNKLKIEAHRVLNNSVRAGLVKRQQCLLCGAQNTHGHHPDYSRPLDVVWLCPKHHKEVHALASA